jgi:hypothetical protein
VYDGTYDGARHRALLLLQPSVDEGLGNYHFGGGTGDAGDPVGASAWLALTLWGIMCFGELRFIEQSAMLILLWGMLFSLPPLYVASKRALDALIDELLRFVISVANGGSPLFALLFYFDFFFFIFGDC